VTGDTPPPERTTPATGVEFPALEAGVTLFDADEPGRPLAALVVDHLLRTDGRVEWIDGGGRVRTTRLRQLAPSRSLLDRIRVARAFTAFQHATLIETLETRLEPVARTDGPEPSADGPEAGAETATKARTGPAAVVCPGLDALATASDLGPGEREELLLTTVASLAAVARDRTIPVVVTLTDAAPTRVADAVAAAANHRLTCESTPFGPRFGGDAGTETLVYAPGVDGRRQTTIAYWARLLRGRARAHALAGPTATAAATATTGESGAVDTEGRVCTDRDHGASTGGGNRPGVSREVTAGGPE
jgi:hypothetical protein